MRGLILGAGRLLWKEHSSVTHEYIDSFQTCGINDRHSTQKLHVENIETGNKCRTLCMLYENTASQAEREGSGELSVQASSKRKAEEF